MDLINVLENKAKDLGARFFGMEACPPNAFTGRLFDPSEPRETRFNIQRCIDYRKQLEKITGVKVCGMCVNVCPVGIGEKSA